jgi:hypothetical protein
MNGELPFSRKTSGNFGGTFGGTWVRALQVTPRMMEIYGEHAIALSRCQLLMCGFIEDSGVVRSRIPYVDPGAEFEGLIYGALMLVVMSCNHDR